MHIDESLTAKGFTPAALVPQVYRRVRTIESITIHHWGAFGQTHDGVVNFFVNGPGLTSAHFVSSAGRTHCLVNPADAAWHAGNPVGNSTSVGIECRPEANENDYQEVAALVAWLRSQYGDLPLIPHRDWQATACPGIWDLKKLDRMARGLDAPAPVITIEPQSTPSPAPAAPPVTTPALGDNQVRVDPGDTLSGIARQFGVDLGALIAENGITEPDRIFPGMILNLPAAPPPPPTYNQCIVDPGDTLSGIAAQFGISLDRIIAVNPGINPDLIYPGQVLNL
jgi:N-acetylmuramoyl-L-alanine amidase